MNHFHNRVKIQAIVKLCSTIACINIAILSDYKIDSHKNPFTFQVKGFYTYEILN